MNSTDFDTTYERLAAYFCEPLNQDKKDEWWKRLQGYPAEAFSHFAEDYIQDGPRFPTLGDAVKRTRERARSGQPDQTSIAPPKSPAYLRAEKRAMQDLMLYLRGQITMGKYRDRLRAITKEEGCEEEVDWSRFDGLEDIPVSPPFRTKGIRAGSNNHVEHLLGACGNK